MARTIPRRRRARFLKACANHFFRWLERACRLAEEEYEYFLLDVLTARLNQAEDRRHRATVRWYATKSLAYREDAFSDASERWSERYAEIGSEASFGGASAGDACCLASMGAGRRPRREDFALPPMHAPEPLVAGCADDDLPF